MARTILGEQNIVTLAYGGANPVTVNGLGGTNVKSFATGDGVTDDTTAFQAALDAAEDGILFLPAGTYLIKGTIYFGNVHIIGEHRNSVIIKCVDDGTWSENGTGIGRDNAMLLPKTDISAAYGFTEVNTFFENITFQYTLGVDNSNMWRCMMFRQWRAGGMRNVTMEAVSGINTLASIALEINEGSDWLTFEKCVFDNRDIGYDAETNGGAVFVRARNSQATHGFVWDQCEFYNNTRDETVAVYTDIGFVGPLYQHSFYDCYIEMPTQNFSGLVIRNEEQASPSDYQVRIDGLRIVVDGTRNITCRGIQLEDCPALITNSEIIINDVGATSTGFQAFRAINEGVTPEQRPTLINCHVYVTDTLSVDLVSAFSGTLDLINCGTSVSGTGNINICLEDITGTVQGGTFTGTDNLVADNVARIVGAELHGECINCYDIQDTTFEIDTNTFNAARPISNTANAKPITNLRNITVNVSGTNTIDLVYLINAATTVRVNGIYVAGDATNMASIRPSILNTTNVIFADELKSITYYDGTTYTRFTDDAVVFTVGGGAVMPGLKVVEFDSTTARAATIADFVNHQGIFMVRCVTAPSSGSHTLTLTSGTFDGTNNVASLDAVSDQLVVAVDPAGNGVVITNNNVVLS